MSILRRVMRRANKQICVALCSGVKRLLVYVALVMTASFAIAKNSAFEDLSHDIIKLFPKATVIGEKDPDFPVWPVYQLSELLGYAFQSNDLVDLPGFSGDRVNLLIGIDTAGEFIGFKVLHHHEPIFMHGLGPQPMLDFIDQYVGHKVSDRIIVGGGKLGSGNSANAAYFDGVTKATVSVIVINDTILSSALRVAKRKLDEFAVSAPAVVNDDLFTPLSWQQLVDRGFVNEWRLTRTDVELELGSSLDSYPGTDFNTEENGNDILFYFAYLNVPTVGRNLLGDAEYERLKGMLKTNEHAVLAMSTGFYSYLEDSFRPGTVPDRISLEQRGLPIPIRDLNFHHAAQQHLMQDAPVFDNFKVFKINSQSGYDPSAVSNIVLNMRLAKNHLVQDEATFSETYQLPGEFFRAVEPDPNLLAASVPTWVRIWQNRAAEIGLLILGLAILSIAFVKQERFSHHVKAFHAFRGGYLFFTLFFIGFYAQGQLSVVNIYTLLLETINGFDIRVFLLDPIIFILWTFTFASVILWGRGLFCGWLCPFGALQEMASWLAKKLAVKQMNIKPAIHERLIYLKYLILFGLVGTSFYSLSLAEQLAEVEPFKTSITLVFMRYWPFVLYAILLLAAGMFIHKFYCRYLCPLGAGLALIGRIRIFSWLERRAECGSPCQLCSKRCGIAAIRDDGQINYDECVQCLECVVILNDNGQCAPSMLEKKKQRAQPAAGRLPPQTIPIYKAS